MKKELIKQARDKMIYDTWEAKKNQWEMKDLAVLFNLSLPQIYKIIKGQINKKLTK